MCERGTRRRGFTLVELLVVIALIVLLAALIFPVLAEARERARRAICLSHVRQIDQAYLLYVADWDEQLPDWYLPGPPRATPFGPRQFWPERCSLICAATPSFWIPAPNGWTRRTSGWRTTR